MDTYANPASSTPQTGLTTIIKCSARCFRIRVVKASLRRYNTRYPLYHATGLYVELFDLYGLRKYVRWVGENTNTDEEETMAMIMIVIMRRP